MKVSVTALPGAMQDHLLHLGSRSFHGVSSEKPNSRSAAQHLHIIGAGRVGLGPGHDRALLDRQLVIGDDEVSSKISFAQPSQPGSPAAR
jgi:hypothetical protein